MGGLRVSHTLIQTAAATQRQTAALNCLPGRAHTHPDMKGPHEGVKALMNSLPALSVLSWQPYMWRV